MKRKPKRTIATFKRSITKLCEQLRWFFYANHMQMNIVWCLGDAIQDSPAAAMIEIDFKYLRFTLKISHTILQFYLDNKDDEVLECLIHEFCHLVINPIYDLVEHDLSTALQHTIQALTERQTQMMTNIFTKLDLRMLKGLVK